MVRGALLVLFFSALAGNAHAQSGSYFMTAEKLYDTCRNYREDSRSGRISGNFINYGLCHGYVLGHIDYDFSFVTMYCLPSDIVQRTAVEIVALYLGQNPSKRTGSAYDAISAALTAAFPCKKTPP